MYLYTVTSRVIWLCPEVIANVMTQISVISYNGNLYASMIADPEIIDEAESVTFTCVSL